MYLKYNYPFDWLTVGGQNRTLESLVVKINDTFQQN